MKDKREVAIKIVEDRLRRTGHEDFDIMEVWHCYILRNNKWLFTSSTEHSPYWEVTYDFNRSCFYVDEYQKQYNACLQPYLRNNDEITYVYKEEYHDFH